MNKIIPLVIMAAVGCLVSCSGNGDGRKFPPGRVVVDSTEIIVTDSIVPAEPDTVPVAADAR